MNEDKKFWLVDLDGTLYRPKAVKLKMAAELGLFGWTVVSVLRSFRKIHEELHEELAQDPSLEFRPSPFFEQVRRTAERSSKSVEEVNTIVSEWMIQRPLKWLRASRREELVEEIRDFVTRGGKAAVVSDYPATKKLEALGILDLFAVVVSSGEREDLHRLKPAPDSYLLAAKELGASPEECLVVGDRVDADGAAAKAANMSFRLVGG